MIRIKPKLAAVRAWFLRRRQSDGQSTKAPAGRSTGSLTRRMISIAGLWISVLLVGGGFALGLRIDQDASYWTTVLPSMLTVSFGMAIAVAPLTTAVLSSVDDHHVGTASGLNSAVSRAGGLIVTALVGIVLSRSGAALIAGLHGAALAGAGLALIASLTAFATLGGGSARPKRKG